MVIALFPSLVMVLKSRSSVPMTLLTEKDGIWRWTFYSGTTLYTELIFSALIIFNKILTYATFLGKKELYPAYYINTAVLSTVCNALTLILRKAAMPSLFLNLLYPEASSFKPVFCFLVLNLLSVLLVLLTELHEPPHYCYLVSSFQF